MKVVLIFILFFFYFQTLLIGAKKSQNDVKVSQHLINVFIYSTFSE